MARNVLESRPGGALWYFRPGAPAASSLLRCPSAWLSATVTARVVRTAGETTALVTPTVTMHDVGDGTATAAIDLTSVQTGDLGTGTFELAVLVDSDPAVVLSFVGNYDAALASNGYTVTVPVRGSANLIEIIPTGPTGHGVPAGGSSGQALRKASGTDYDTEWFDPATQAELDAGITAEVTARNSAISSAVSTHAAASDPHGDRAYALGLVDDLSGVSNPTAARANVGRHLETGLPQTLKKLQAAAAGPSQLKVINWGDSYASKVWMQLGPAVQSVIGGPVGAMFSGPLDGLTINATSGTITSNTTDYTVWPSGLTDTFAAGASRTYGLGGGSVYSDTIKVVYAKGAGGGVFKLQVDGVDEAGYTAVDTTVGSGIGIITVSKTAGNHTVTIVGVSGTPKLITVGMIDSTGTGTVTMCIGQGGLDMPNWSNAAALANFQAFVADIQPDLMTFEMKETTSGYQAAAEAVFAAARAGYAALDILAIGSTPVASGDATQVACNASVRAAAVNQSAAYFDTYSLFGSYAALAARGWNGDGVHVSTDCDKFRGQEIGRYYGLFDAWGRNASQRTPIAGRFEIRRTGDRSSQGYIEAEPVFAQDINFRMLNRWLSFLDDTGTEFARLDPKFATSYLPSNVSIANAGPRILSSGSGAASLLTFRRYATTDAIDIQVRRVSMSGNTVNGASGTVALDLNLGGWFVVNLTGNVTSFSFSNPGNGGEEIEVQFVQDATGSRTLSGASPSIKWAGGAAPTLSTVANRRDIFRFRQDSGGYYEIARSMNVG